LQEERIYVIHVFYCICAFCWRVKDIINKKNAQNGSFKIMSAVVLQSALNELPIVIVFGDVTAASFSLSF
jgi:hypothetical protein